MNILYVNVWNGLHTPNWCRQEDISMATAEKWINLQCFPPSFYPIIHLYCQTLYTLPCIKCKKLNDEGPLHDSSWMSDSLLSGENRWLCLWKHNNTQLWIIEQVLPISSLSCAAEQVGTLNIAPGGYTVLKIPAVILHWHINSRVVCHRSKYLTAIAEHLFVVLWLN